MNKLQALKTTIEKIESGEYPYDWRDEDHCNCGLVATTVLGKSEFRNHGLHDNYHVESFGAPWTRASHCMTTGLPLPEVFKKLKDAGFSRYDIIELEYLANETICNRLGWKRHKNPTKPYYFSVDGCDLKYNIKENLIAYLSEWVKILECEQPHVKQVIRYVAVPETINEQAKKLILS